jgi:hypothetical protein
MKATRPAAEVAALDATAQAELVREGEVAPTELVEWAIERIDGLNPSLNAVVTQPRPTCLSGDDLTVWRSGPPPAARTSAFAGSIPTRP